MKISKVLFGIIALPLLSIAMEQPPHLKPAASSTPRRIIIRQKPKTKNQSTQRNAPFHSQKKAAAMPSMPDINFTLLYRFLDAEINNDHVYLSSQNIATYQAVINSANNVYNNAYEVSQLQRRYKTTEEQIRKLINQVIQDAYDGINAFRRGPLYGQEKA